MNTESEKEPSQAGVWFVTALGNREKSSIEGVSAEEQISLLRDATNCLLKLVEQVALFGASEYTLLRVLTEKLKKVGTPGDTVPIIQLSDSIAMQYHDIAVFCKNYEKMARDKILQDAGVDPNDKEAVLKFMQKTSALFNPDGSKAAANN